MARKKSFRRPPCPDPDLYEWVQRKDGTGYWRRRRQHIPLNTKLAENSRNMGKVSPISKMLADSFRPHLGTIVPGHIFNRINQALMSWMTKHGKLDLKALQGMDFQEKTTFLKAFGGLKIVAHRNVDKEVYRVELAMLYPFIQEWPNKGLSHYRYGLVLLRGKSAKDRQPEVIFDFTERFAKNQKEGTAVLELPLAKKTAYWILCLRAELFERGEYIVRGHRNVRMFVLDAEGEIK